MEKKRCALLDHVCDTPITADAADDHKALQTGPERDATDARRAEALLGFVSGAERRTRVLRGGRRTRALGMSSPAAIASSTRPEWMAGTAVVTSSRRRRSSRGGERARDQRKHGAEQPNQIVSTTSPAVAAPLPRISARQSARCGISGGQAACAGTGPGFAIALR
jgi:hypothetical protein